MNTDGRVRGKAPWESVESGSYESQKDSWCTRVSSDL